MFKGYNLGEIIEEMFAHMKTQVKNLALANSRFVFNGVPELNFKKMAIIPKNEEDEECFNGATLVAIHHENVNSYPEQISKVRRFEGNYDWRGLEFPLPP